MCVCMSSVCLIDSNVAFSFIDSSVLIFVRLDLSLNVYIKRVVAWMQCLVMFDKRALSRF